MEEVKEYPTTPPMPVYTKKFVVVKALDLDELAEKLTTLSDDSSSITIIKTTKVENEYQALVKRVQEDT